VDLMTGKAHAIAPTASDGARLTFADVPLRDYPLLLTDRAGLATT
ncbi:hypothetical protein HQ560_21330, partial [bacterium]|nr:hypothetical protein [bacterium]